MPQAVRHRSPAPIEAPAQASPDPPDPIIVESVLGMTPEVARSLGRDVPLELLLRGHKDLIEGYWQERFDEELASSFDESQLYNPALLRHRPKPANETFRHR